MTQCTPSSAQLAAEKIRQIAPHVKPKLGLVLGSGLGRFAEQLDDAIAIRYEDLPGFPKTTVAGHEGNLVLGYIEGVPLICLQGRAHSFEGPNHETVKTYVRTLRLLGCDYFLATNASGSLREEVGPGELMLISDHINLQPGNPLVGPNDSQFGPRFYPMDNAYDKELKARLLETAKKEQIKLHEGVYIGVLGPNYETTAEIKAFRILGADAVGMSTIPEVLVANHCGLKVAVIATITNYATGLAKTSHDHKAVLEIASQATHKLTKLLRRFIKELSLP